MELCSHNIYEEGVWKTVHVDTELTQAQYPRGNTLSNPSRYNLT